MPTEKRRSKFIDRTPRSDEGEVSGVRINHDVICVLSGDWHLSHKPPVARTAESNWYDAMHRSVQQVISKCNLLCCPLIIAGDLFDRWNSPAELINWTLDQFDHLNHTCFTVAGNHDLAFHNLEDIKKTAYWTLVRGGAIRHLMSGVGNSVNELTIHGFHCGEKVTSCPERHLLDKSIHIAVIHDYIWTNTTGHPGADEEKKYTKWLNILRGYDSVCFGDNHKTICKGSIVNTGSLMRRKADEIDHKPCVGLLHEDGSITLEYLDCSQDKWIDGLDVLQQADKGSDLDLTGFMEELTGLTDSDLNFGEAVLRFMESKGPNEKVRKLLLNAIGQG